MYVWIFKLLLNLIYLCLKIANISYLLIYKNVSQTIHLFKKMILEFVFDMKSEVLQGRSVWEFDKFQVLGVRVQYSHRRAQTPNGIPCIVWIHCKRLKFEIYRTYSTPHRFSVKFIVPKMPGISLFIFIL